MASDSNIGGRAASSPSPAPAGSAPQGRGVGRFGRISQTVIHGVVMVLSLALIVYISYDTFENIPFLENHRYMMFQFWVCVVFIFDFFYEWTFAPRKWSYLRRRWFFLLISIPYLNLINYLHVELPENMLYYLRFVPLVRGGYSLALVVGYVSNNRAVSLVSQYAVILVTMIYLIALLFYYEERGVNPDVHSFWDALYWALMNCSTVGCSFWAVTTIGKILTVVLPTMGMLMLPLFTVFVTNSVQNYDSQHAAGAIGPFPPQRAKKDGE